jgi:hypothetical protein
VDRYSISEKLTLEEEKLEDSSRDKGEMGEVSRKKKPSF